MPRLCSQPIRLLILVAWLAPVVNATEPVRPISFELDVQPILTALSCNSGACHGKQRGQNGFQLSLLAFDSDFDHAALVRDARGRRIFPAAPDYSLLLLKATAAVPHGGGPRLEPSDDAYRTLRSWIEQGAPRRVEGEPTLESVSLARDSFSLTPKEGGQLQVTAHYSDGSSRDVTELSTFLSNEDAVVSVSDEGAILAGPLPGETAVMARYMNHIQVAHVAIPQTQAIPAERFDSLPRNGFIDELVYAKLESLGIEPSPTVPDAAFLRRVHLDLIGRLPTADEARQFIESSDGDKREKLVDSLLERPEYVDHWAGYWADLLRPNPYRVGIKAVFNYDNWIRQQFRDDVRYDTFVRRLITAKGSTWHNGAATLYRDRRGPDEVATMASQLFLGIRLECAKCHHHPFERWSQENFYQFAAYFAKVDYKGTGLSPPISGGEEVVFTSTGGSVTHPLTGAVMSPTPLFDLPPSSAASASSATVIAEATAGVKASEAATGNGPLESDPVDPRDELAQWMTARENDFFAKVQVNRMWAALMGRGLVDPVDDLRMTNPPSNPALLDALAEQFRASGYDLKHLLKTMVLSRVYSHSSEALASNASDRLNYSRHYRHRLRAEVLMDAVADVTDQPLTLPAMPPRSRSHQVWTTRVDSVFLDTFGRPNENQDPPCERTPDATVTQALHLMNSQQIEQQIRSDGSRAHQWAASELTPAAIVEELYLTVYSRFPSDEERAYAVGLLAEAENRRHALEDLMWAMLNSPEFSIQN